MAGCGTKSPARAGRSAMQHAQGMARGGVVKSKDCSLRATDLLLETVSASTGAKGDSSEPRAAASSAAAPAPVT